MISHFIQLSKVYIEVSADEWKQVLGNTDDMVLPDGVPNFLEPDPDTDLLFVRNITCQGDLSDAEILTLVSQKTDGVRVLRFHGTFTPEDSENLVMVSGGKTSGCTRRKHLQGSSEVLLITMELTPLTIEDTTTEETHISTTQPSTHPVTQAPTNSPTTNRLTEEDVVTECYTAQEEAEDYVIDAAQTGDVKDPSMYRQLQVSLPDSVSVAQDSAAEEEEDLTDYDFSLRAQDQCRCREGKDDAKAILPVTYSNIDLDCDLTLEITDTSTDIDDSLTSNMQLIGGSYMTPSGQIILPSDGGLLNGLYQYF
eukprot:Blabericola_migrator_1__832@NODE_1204_length_5111_cov_220_956384_g816_i0_p2_GENE_NODE_1204_length_5111_cov_220_956384_g816_i0NODE_1204_length_5111_cov_220_956384_g816_i0_p2_ORF_typecomplete_len310_score73_57_NODE_1204_length_5111_cov_220_956384_g816_i038414770